MGTSGRLGRSQARGNRVMNMSLVRAG